VNWWHRNIPPLSGLFVGGLIGDELAGRPGILSWGPLLMAAILWVGLDFYWNRKANEE